MTTKSLGKLRRVDLREVWDNEAGSFTPWLAREENIKLLGDAIGVELEVHAKEKDVGPFRADILCKDTANDTWVLIENQLERTDHNHLGQLLTYAAGLNAVSIVWIAQRFTDEHRAALDWLNEVTSDNISFFGAEIELWKIGASEPAPKFNIVSRPYETPSIIPPDTSKGKKLQLEFWTAFAEHLRSQGKHVRPTKPLPQHWMNVAMGKSGTKLAAIASFFDSQTSTFDQHELRTEVVLFDQNAKAYFNALEAEKEEIEKALGYSMTWYNPEDKRMCRIYLRRTCDLEARETWEEQHAWLAENLEKLHRVFAPRVKQLKPEEAPEEGGQSLDASE